MILDDHAAIQTLIRSL